VHGLMLAAGITPDNTPHGYNWTFLYPMLLFIIVGGALYLVLTRPHDVPGHGTLPTPAQGAADGHTATGNVAAATSPPQTTQVSGATAVADTEQTQSAEAEGPEASE
jgi:hypothetical protein